MKSKIILNILIVYFLILCLVLLFQVSSKKINAIEPLPSEITAEDKLKNSVVSAINSPVVIINEKQFLIDEKDSTLVPIIDGGKVYMPVKFLETAFGANISFSTKTKETIIRLDNKAIIFSNYGTSIHVIDNIKEETIDVDEEAKIINDRFYIPLRSFADIFDKEVFYNNDLIIISNIENLFDPIEEIDILQELEKQVKHLPIIGNQDNLKYLLKNSVDIQNIEPHLINTENIEEKLKENKPVIIEKTNNYNIYATEGFIEVYFVTKDNKEIFSFKVEKLNNNIKDIKITDDRFVITYLDNNTKTIIYNISDRQNIKTMEIIENNGDLYKTVIDDNNLYIISKIDVDKYKDKQPYFAEYVYENNIGKEITEKRFDLDKIFYFPDMKDKKYTLISYINLYDIGKPLYSGVYLGMGENILINKDMIYVLTFNNGNNNLYQFKATLDGVEYIKRQFIKGEFKSLEIDREKQFIRVNLKDKTIHFDNSLAIR
ncbi:stalk domain-containing protein [uncultured Tyzzerella sp.]|uniref:stalk domain-containing protein n=1 Tax=uncultured Tyzzerella sp. TaxID=2321398 RepID=UPI00294329A3|nr:stalk domain-containing protein [uncultured Tyzzerella sp.]